MVVRGIKLKNLKKIKGQSLIQIVAKLISQIKIFDNAVISTDNKKIAKEAIKYGLKFYNYRPKKLSGDRISDVDVIKYTLTETEKTEKEKISHSCNVTPNVTVKKKKKMLKVL